MYMKGLRRADPGIDGDKAFMKRSKKNIVMPGKTVNVDRVQHLINSIESYQTERHDTSGN